MTSLVDDRHEEPAWMTAPPEKTAVELVEEFWRLAGCPQLAKSEGETCCGICLDELGWVALDLIPRLLAGAEAE